MPVTSPYSLPYPTDSSPVDVAADIQALAVATNTALATAGSGTGGWRNSFLLMGA